MRISERGLLDVVRRITVTCTIILLGITPLAKGAAYVGSVLYPLTPPSGFSNVAFLGISGGQTVGISFQSNNNPGNFNATLWTAAGAVNLNPGNMTVSAAFGSDGSEQVGDGQGTGTGNDEHALIWSGTAASALDLNPTNLSGISNSDADAVSGNQQVGSGSGTGTGNNFHALLWNGTANSAVDLNPAGITNSIALGTNGTQQVGYTFGSESGNNDRANMWTGTADSAVELNPANFTASQALGISPSGTQEVGWGRESTAEHAMIWSGTADSAVDLNPTDLNMTSSFAVATNGVEQVGFGTGGVAGSFFDPVVWTGTADSAVDLEKLLPSSGTWTGILGTRATAPNSYIDVDSTGNVYGAVFGTYQGTTGFFAVEWSPVPEPATGSMVLIGCVGILMRRKGPC